MVIDPLNASRPLGSSSISVAVLIEIGIKQ